MNDQEHEVTLAMRAAGSRRATTLAALAGVAVAVIAIGTVLAINDTESPEHARGQASTEAAPIPGVGVVGPGEPCRGAIHLSPSALASAAGQSIWLPKGASDNLVTDAWSCRRGSAPVLMFGDIQVTYQPGDTEADVANDWSRYIEEYGGYTFDLSGHSVLVHEGTQYAPYNEVLIPMGDTLILLNSLGEVPIEDVVDLAKSLNLETPAIRAEGGYPVHYQ